MLWDTDFELTRLLRLLTERLGPGCIGRVLVAGDMEDLMKEIHWESDKIYLEVMKVMCRGYSEEHLRRYLEVHLEGLGYLQGRLDDILLQANETCLQLFEAFKGVLERVSLCLLSWQKRYFGDGTDLKDWLTKAQVEDELHITQSTFYRRKKEAKWKTRIINGIEHYLRRSLYE